MRKLRRWALGSWNMGRMVGSVGGLIGVVVAGAVAILRQGSPEARIEAINLNVSLSLIAVGWSLVGLLGAVVKWPTGWLPGALMLGGGAIGFLTLPGYFLVPGALLVVGGLLTLWETVRRGTGAGTMSRRG